MIRQIVFWGLCAVLAFMPLPFGSVDPWAYHVFEAATLVLFLVYIAGGRERAERGEDTRPAYGNTSELSREDRDSRIAWTEPGGLTQTGRGEAGGRAVAFPLFFRILLGVFVAVSIVQIVPLPAAVVKVVSPRAFAIFEGLARDGLGGWQTKTWFTLSLGPQATMEKLVLVLCYGLFGYLVMRTVRTRAKMEIMVLVMLASGLFQAFYGLTEHFSGTERIFGLKKTWGVGSATGTYVNRNHFAGFLEMIFPLSLGYLLAKARFFMMEKGLSLRRKILWFSQERLQWTILLGLVSVFLGTGLVFSKSRSGVLIFLVTMVFAAAAVSGWRTFSEGDEGGRSGGRGDGGGSGGSEEEEGSAGGATGGDRKRFGMIVRIVFAVVLAAALWLGVDPIIRRFMELDVTGAERRTFMRNTLEMAADYPLAGVGKGTYVYSYAMYEKADDWQKLSYAHNDYLQILAENGFVGGGCLILAGLGLFLALIGRWRRRRDSFAKAVGLGAILGVAAILLHGITDFNLQIPANAVYFVGLCALGWLASTKLGGHHT